MPNSRETNEIAFLTNEQLWPNWPLLPLKRQVNGELQLGVLFTGENSVRLQNMWEEPKANTPCLDYPSRKAIFFDGWRVD